MDEVTANLSEHQEQEPKIIAGTGKRQSFSFVSSNDDESNISVREDQNAAAGVVTETNPVTAAIAEDTQKSATSLTDDQIKAYFKSLNIDFDGDVESLKEKLKPRSAEPSEDEKIALQKAEEKAILDLYLENGGTIDQFGAIKGIANSNIEELSRTAAIKEFTDAGFTKEEAEAEISYRYYLNALDTVEQDEDETDEEFEERKAKIQKKVDFGAKKLAAKSLYIQQQAQNFFTGLKDAIKAKEAQKQQEGQYSSKVEEYFSKMPREMTFELGERNGQKLDPIKFRVSDKALNSAKEVLKDTAKRNEFFFNNDGTLNIENATKLLVAYNNQQEAPQVFFREGETRATQTFESVFPGRSAYQVGVGGVSVRAGEKGQISGRGTPERVRTQQFQK